MKGINHIIDNPTLMLIFLETFLVSVLFSINLEKY